MKENCCYRCGSQNFETLFHEGDESLAIAELETIREGKVRLFEFRATDGNGNGVQHIVADYDLQHMAQKILKMIEIK